ncbi:hypothetical protein GCM10009819_09000 [Agromyces tropicus]|uniref:Uncharacterized protein n=1 Tax=Agromyces tropicus TaxID=555371 RepID=A0ABN2U4F8_9MICO
MNVWATLAAVIPILGALIAGVLYLLDQRGLRRERALRRRVRDEEAEYREQMQASLIESGAKESAAMMQAIGLGMEFRERRLAEHGIAKPGPTNDDFDIGLAMTGPVAGWGEITRQTIVLVSAALGMACLAIQYIESAA